MNPIYPQLNGGNVNFLQTLIAALIVVESGGDPNAVGDGGRSVGILQIQEICIQDVNRLYGTDYEWPQDARDPNTSREICRLYLTHYLKHVQNPAPVDAARIWNGGPRGYLKTATIGYWKRVQPLYAQECCKRANQRMLDRQAKPKGGARI